MPAPINGFLVTIPATIPAPTPATVVGAASTAFNGNFYITACPCLIVVRVIQVSFGQIQTGVYQWTQTHQALICRVLGILQEV